MIGRSFASGLGALALLLSSPASGQGVVTALPEAIETVEAAYPEEARAQGLAGEVGLEVDISETGEVLDVRVVAPAGSGFDEAAVEAVSQFRFSPAEVDGIPTAVTIEYRYHFELAQEPAPPPADGILRGRIVSSDDGVPLPGALVDAGGEWVVEADGSGNFELRDLPEGPLPVVVVAPDHERFETTETIEADTLTQVVYHLEPSPTSPYESVVRGRRERKEVSTVAITRGEIDQIPGTFGDTVKVVQNLPGVARTPYGAGVIIVRGGEAHDTRAYIDGQYVPILFHFGGLSSVYASELVEEVEFEAGNFGARYGRAIGGRVEIVTRDPGDEALHLVADADLYDATALVETPVAEGLSVALAARRSYVDAILSSATQLAPDSFEGVGFSVAPRFWDYQGKIAYKPNESNRLRLDLYGSSDRLALSGIDPGFEGDMSMETATAFSRLAFTWDHRLDASTRTRVIVAPGWDHLAFSMDPLLFNVDSYSLTARAEGYHDVSPMLSLGAGLDLLLAEQRFVAQLPFQAPGQIPAPDFRDNLMFFDLEVTTLQPAIWTEAVFRPIPSLELIPGLRLDADSYLGEAWFDPRFAVRWAAAEGTLLKGAVGIYHQPPPLQAIGPELGNPDLGPEGAIQYVAGVEQRLVGPLSLDLQLYYKELFDLAFRSERVVRRGGEEVVEMYANSGAGASYGLEALLRYDPDGRFFGWVGYSATRSERENTRDGVTIPSLADQPHSLIAVGVLQLPEVWDGLSVGARLRATSGNPYTPVEGGFYDADSDRHRRVSSELSRSQRLPPFFQLDLRVDKRWDYGASSLGVYLDVQNVTNTQNAEGVMYNFDYSEQRMLPGLPFFPSIGLRWEL